MLLAWEAIIWLPVNCVTMSSPRNWERQAVRDRTTQEKLLSLAVMHRLRAGMTYDLHTLTEDRSNSFHSLTVCGRRRHFRTLETDGYIKMALNKLHFCGESKLFPWCEWRGKTTLEEPALTFSLKGHCVSGGDFHWQITVFRTRVFLYFLLISNISLLKVFGPLAAFLCPMPLKDPLGCSVCPFTGWAEALKTPP